MDGGGGGSTYVSHKSGHGTRDVPYSDGGLPTCSDMMSGPHEVYEPAFPAPGECDAT